jgi:hypothetical protein
MANTKITGLTELAAKPATDDILAIVDVTGTDTTKKITVENLFKSTATVASTVATADTTDASCFVALFEASTGNQAAKTDAGLSYNAGTGTLTATALVGPLAGNVTGNVTGNASGTAATVTTAAQPAITSVGTLTSLKLATSTPASASATGTIGTIAWDTGYIYVCTATDTWERVAIATW